MIRTLFPALLLLLAAGPLGAQVPTATFTPTPNCCQTDPGWTPPPLAGAADVSIDPTLNRAYVTEYVPAGAVRARTLNGASDPSFGVGGAVSVTGAFGVDAGPCSFEGVYVTQRDVSPSYLRKYTTGGALVWTSSPLPGGMRMAYVDPVSGTIHVTHDNNSIYLFDQMGALQATLTGLGLNIPTGMVKVGTDLFLADSWNNRVVRLPQTGPYSYGAPVLVAAMPTPHGIARDGLGNFYVTSFGTDSIHIFSPTWTLLATCAPPGLNGPLGIDLDPTGAVYVAGQLSSSVMKIRPCNLFTQPAWGGCGTPTPTGTATSTATFTATRTSTPGTTATSTSTSIGVLTATATSSATATRTPTPPSLPTSTATATPTPTMTGTPPPMATSTPTPAQACTGTFTVPVNLFRPDQGGITVTADPCGPYELGVYNSAGEKVRILAAQGSVPPASFNYDWDGNNEKGEPCASGVYLLRLAGPYEVRLAKVILLR
jgi:hypothetical protein